MTDFTAMSARAARSSSDAMTGYASAALAAYSELAAQSFSWWARALSPPAAEDEPRSWYRHPDAAARTPQRAAMPAFSPFGWSPWTLPVQSAMPWLGASGMPRAMPNPFTLWLGAWPLQGNPAAWPMAFAMMSFGVSRQVAFPLANANVAAIDAVNVTGRLMEETFCTYRTDGGHASAQVRVASDNRSAGAAMASGLALFAPWLALLGPQGERR